MNRHVWITTYESGPARSKIQSGCVSPKQKTDFVNENYGRYFFVRAEVMTEPSCKGQKTCDTDIQVNSREMGTNIVIHANARDANRCYLDTK